MNELLLVRRDARGVRVVDVPGLTDVDGVTPLPIPLDNDRWKREFYAKALIHRERVRRETRHSDAAGLAARRIHRRLCQTPGGLGAIYYGNTFAHVFEPRASDPSRRVLPMILWPRQIELQLTIAEVMAVEAPHPLANLAVEKTRACGATWNASLANICNWQFDEFPFAALLISIDQDAVDKRHNLGSWFGKLDFLLKKQPEFLLPRGFSWAKEPGNHRTHMKLHNPETDSTIVGVATTDDAGRSDRVTVADIDEAGFNPAFEEIYNLLFSTTDHRRCYSSVTRKNPAFYNLIHGEGGWRSPRVFRFESHQVPGRDAAWHKAAEASIGKPAKYRREILLDWFADEENTQSYPQAQQKQVGRFAPVKGWATYLLIDDGVGHDTALVYVQIAPDESEVRVLYGFANNRKPIGFYGSLITGQLDEAKYEYDEGDRAFLAWLTTHNLFAEQLFGIYGDRHGMNTSLTDMKSPFQLLREEWDVDVFVSHDPELNREKERREHLQEWIRLMVFDEEAGVVLQALKANKLPERKTGSQFTNEDVKPIHDGSIHYCAALQYGAINLLPRIEIPVTELEPNLTMSGRHTKRVGRRVVPGETLIPLTA